MDCVICLCPIESDLTQVQCGEITCTETICAECLDLYIRSKLDAPDLPRCVSTKCSGIYLYGTAQCKGTSETADNYRALCAAHYVNAHSTDIQKTAEKQRLIEALRKQRHDFITRAFPKSVEIVAGIVFPAKLNRVVKSRADKVSRTVRDARRICMNIFCNGHLTDDLVCLSCDTRFCPRCEDIAADGHACNKDNVESVQRINTMTRCPSCQLPVERSTGCASMTCANSRCQARFDINTGEAISHGGHSTAVAVPDSRKLSLDMQEQPDLLRQMVHLESFQPSPVTDQAIVKWVAKIMATGPAGQDLAFQQHKLCRAVEQYYKRLTLRRFINRAMAETEHMYRKNTLTPDHIKTAIREIEIAKSKYT